MSAESEADRIATAVRALPQVAGLHGGRFGEIATLAPLRRIGGVRVRDEDVTVAVSVRYPFTAADVANAVRGCVGHMAMPVHVVIANVVAPDDDTAPDDHTARDLHHPDTASERDGSGDADLVPTQRHPRNQARHRKEPNTAAADAVSEREA